MNIQPPSSHPREISVTEPVGLAYERMKLMLFRPFDLGRWFVIGFCAWLAGLGESGGYGGSYHGSNDISGGGRPLDQLRHSYEHAHAYVLENLAWLVPLVAAGLIVGLGLMILFVWLSSRGKFMFLHCVALNKAEVEIPWDKYAGAAGSLFWFRLALLAAGLLLLAPVLVILGLVFVGIVQSGDVGFVQILPLMGAIMGIFVIVLVFALIHKFMVDFVVPLMYLRGGTCMAGWREFFRLFSGHAGDLILYILFQIILAIVIGLGLVVVVLLTCCTAGCLLWLPYLGTVLLLPVLIFKRAYSVYYLAQFGPLYDVFPAEPPAPPVPPPGLRPV